MSESSSFTKTELAGLKEWLRWPMNDRQQHLVVAEMTTMQICELLMTYGRDIPGISQARAIEVWVSTLDCGYDTCGGKCYESRGRCSIFGNLFEVERGSCYYHRLDMCRWIQYNYLIDRHLWRRHIIFQPGTRTIGSMCADASCRDGNRCMPHKVDLTPTLQDGLYWRSPGCLWAEQAARAIEFEGQAEEPGAVRWAGSEMTVITHPGLGKPGAPYRSRMILLDVEYVAREVSDLFEGKYEQEDKNGD